MSAARTTLLYDSYGNETSVSKYDFGASSPSFVTTTSYGTWTGSTCGSIGNGIQSRVCHVIEADGSSHTLGEHKYTYDSHGNMLTKSDLSGGTWLTTTNTYNSNGTVATSQDPNLTTTYLSYAPTGSGGCSGLLLTQTQVTPVTGDTLTSNRTWNCDGVVPLTVTDANGNGPTYTYNDPLFRATSVTDASGQGTNMSYGVNSTQISATVGTSIIESDTLTDGFGRVIDSQSPESPSSGNYDTVSTSYGWSGVLRETDVSASCIQTFHSLCPSYYGYTRSDTLGRPIVKMAPNSMTNTTFSYNKNDVIATLSPVTSGENLKIVQTEADAFGRTKSVCTVSSATGSASCGQNTTATGFVTTYAYTTATNTTTTTATRGSEMKTSVFDPLGRATTATTPEAGTDTYSYDLATADCATGSLGNLVETKYANGNYICYTYDGMHRLTDATPNSPSTANVCHRFRYDNSTGVTGTIPSGVSLATFRRKSEAMRADGC
jgi:YD repeat-containing protein